MLEILVDNIEIKPYSEMRSGMIQDGVIIKFHNYNMDSILTQMLDDYGEEELIKRIKALE